MNKYPTLKNAPIVEAIIDFRVILPEDFNVSTIQKIAGSIKDDYPKEEFQKRADFHFGLDNDKQIVKPKTDNAVINGFRYWADDKKQVVLFTSEGFTFSRLSPYINWKHFITESKKLWSIYKDYVTPRSIIRVAVRYINKIVITNPKTNLEDILKAPPVLPPDITQEIDSFFNRIIIHKPNTDMRAVITQTSTTDVKSSVPTIILDIDAFCDRHDGIEDDKVWSIIEKIREFKNDIFFNSITDKQLEEYK